MTISHRRSRPSHIDASEAKARLRARAEELSLQYTLKKEPKLVLGLAFTAGLLCSLNKTSVRDCIVRLDRILQTFSLPEK
jgi:hypothetical protein